MKNNWAAGFVVVVVMMSCGVAGEDVYTQVEAYRCFTEKASKEC